MGLDLKDWNGHPLDNGFYEDQRKKRLCFIRREGEKYFISEVDEDERELSGTPNQHFMMHRIYPWDYVEGRKRETDRIVKFIKSKPEGKS